MANTLDCLVPGIRTIPKTNWKANITPSSHVLEARHKNAVYRVERDPRDNCLVISSDFGNGIGNRIFGAYNSLNTSKSGIVKCHNSAFYDSLMSQVTYQE